ALLGRARSITGDLVSSFELIPAIGLDFVLRHGPNTRAPLEGKHPWMVLAKWTAGEGHGLEDLVLGFLSEATGDGLLSDAVVARSTEQAADFWRLRELLSECQKPEGGSIKHDVSVPISAIPAFIEAANAAVAAACPGIRPVPFGHVGDGNIHYNLSQPVDMDKAAFLARWEDLSGIVHDITAAHAGSISAEHGIGVMKQSMLPRYKSPVELAMMHSLKNALDPLGLMNPGKILSPYGPWSRRAGSNPPQDHPAGTERPG
ncbi:MAG: FAD-binding oxidoreductase, partial [Alphaproteobacteria bacterium]